MDTSDLGDVGNDHVAVSHDAHDAVASPPPSRDDARSATVAANAIDMKKTGRPVHPLWAHFHRGEKRNRYHYHAFCIYCVARYGAEHVAPTRGVSSDMLRHVEKCTNCPRKVVESIKDVCGRRDAVRFDRYLKKKSDSGGDDLHHELDDADGTGGGSHDHHHNLEHAATAPHDDNHHNEQLRHHLQQQQQSSGHQRNGPPTGDQQDVQQHFQQQQLQHFQQEQEKRDQQHMGPSGADGNGDTSLQHHSMQHTSQTGVHDPNHPTPAVSGTNTAAAHASMSATNGIHAVGSNAARALSRGSAGSNSTLHSRHLGKHALRTAFESASRAGNAMSRNDHNHHSETATMNHGGTNTSAKRLRASVSTAIEWKVSMLKTAVTAGLPFHAFQNAEFQELLRYVHPAIGSSERLTSITDANFLSEAAGRLALIQLDRVKEGMHNSTIKGGLTLSINCWSTLDLQQLVSFTLVNSNGDAACVCVIDMGTQANAYSSAQLAVKIEDVLVKLESLRICVMGIVADSIIALNAARCVCNGTRRQSLLVVPCFARQLSLLAGSLLTHARFRDAVGQMIEIASYFSNGSLGAVLKAISGEANAIIPMPNRDNWFSFLECITAMLKYCDVVTAICSTPTTTTTTTGGDADEAAGLSEVRPPHRLNELVFADEGKLWKTLQELHTLLLPLKETYLLVFQHKSRAAGGEHEGEARDAEDPGQGKHQHPHDAHDHGGGSSSREYFTAAHGLTLAHVMYQLARMHQQYAGLVSTHHAPLAQMMQERINITWQRYDLPVMVLAYVFNFHLDTSLLNMESRRTDAFQWDTIASYFQSYFTRWFQSLDDAGKAMPAAAESGDASSSPSPSSFSAPMSTDKVHEIFRAYKLSQFPFDAATTSDYADVSSFYSFVSDSHPEICALCCRMYAISLLSANVHRIVRGIGFAPTTTTTQTTKSPEVVELLLHVGFASSMKPAGDTTSGSRSTSSSDAITGLDAVMQGCHPDEIFWNDDVWDEFATEWQTFLELELQMEEFDAITHEHEETENDSERTTEAMLLLQGKVPLDEVFIGTLAPLSTLGASSSTATMTTSSSSATTNTNNHATDAEEDDDAVLSMEM